MDCSKVGALILKLRTEKGMTQAELADKLNISNKTVSKWECGLGCPDITLWGELSALFGVDIQKLLQGELKPNKPDTGKIDKVRFYVCPVCGNILISSSEAAVSCCGRQLESLKPRECDDMHKVNAEESDLDYYLTFDHDMTKEHYISFVALVHYDCVLLVRMYPEQSPEVRLPAMKRGGRVYFYCTGHGLYKCNFLL